MNRNIHSIKCAVILINRALTSKRMLYFHRESFLLYRLWIFTHFHSVLVKNANIYASGFPSNKNFSSKLTLNIIFLVFDVQPHFQGVFDVIVKVVYCWVYVGSLLDGELKIQISFAISIAKIRSLFDKHRINPSNKQKCGPNICISGHEYIFTSLCTCLQFILCFHEGLQYFYR